MVDDRSAGGSTTELTAILYAELSAIAHRSGGPLAPTTPSKPPPWLTRPFSASPVTTQPPDKAVPISSLRPPPPCAGSWLTTLATERW